MITVNTFVLGDIYTNTYLLKDEATGALAVIDPAVESRELIDAINSLGGKLEYILLTHGHFDHICGVAALLKEFSPKVCVSKDEVDFLANPQLNGCAWHNISIDEIPVDNALSDNDIIMLGDSSIRFIETPGHTGGSGCYIVDDMIFSGDTLFYGSIGRTDFPTSSMSDMMKSLKKLSALDGDYTVFPGHDISTTLDYERRYNPYMR